MTASAAVPNELRIISVRLPILTELARRGRLWEFPPAGEGAAERRRQLSLKLNL